MQMQGLRYEMVCSSKTGLVRGNNEDNFCFFGKVMPMNHQSLEGLYSSTGSCADGALVGVFDGMGGHARGELASFTAAEALAAIAREEREGSWDGERLAQALRDLNAAVLDAGVRAQAKNTGSTATLFALNGGDFVLANLGDSPAFLFRDGRMRELSIRHTDAALVQSFGMKVRGRPRLMQYLGIPEDVMGLEPHIACEQVQDRDVILLCTDGLTDMVDVADIQAAVGDGTNLRRAYTRLRDATMAAGARDNFTVLLCRLDSVSES